MNQGSGSDIMAFSPTRLFLETFTMNLALTMTLSAAMLAAAPPPDFSLPKGYLCRKAASPITVDGKLDDASWSAAAWTNDFADIEGDRAGGCRTLPIIYGVKKAAWMISPSFVLPWILLPLGAYLKILTGNPIYLSALGTLLALWGSYVCYLILRRPEELAATENHISWTHMYRMMMVTQIGFMLAYLLP